MGSTTATAQWASGAALSIKTADGLSKITTKQVNCENKQAK